jgi:hypothetical protein
MKPRLAVVAVASLALFGASPGGTAVGVATVRMVIAHVFEHCHVWTLAPKPLGAVKTLGANARIVVRLDTRVVIRSDCPMDFNFKQTKGPRLTLGSPRMYAGTSRTIVFAKVGLYRLTATNVQTPEERGLTTLGTTNLLTLTVVVKRY